MDARRLDMQAWEAVAGDLVRLVEATHAQLPPPLLAPIRHRIGVIRLRRALLEEFDAVREALGTEDGAESLLALLDRQLAGDSGAKGLLEALRGGSRSEAEAALKEALEGDPGHRASLRASVALAAAAGRWPEAIALLERLADREQGDAIGRVYQELGDVYWRRLSEAANARPWYIKARKVLGDETKLLDKLLKLDLELENWEEAIGACHLLIDKTQRRKKRPELSVTYMLTMGEIHVYGMRQPQVAMTYYLLAVSRLPDYDLSYTLLQELLHANDWDAVEPNLDLLPDEEVAAIQGPLEQLRKAVEGNSGDVTGALTAFRAAMTS